MNRRALVLSLVLAAVGVILLLLYMRTFEREVSGGDRVELLMLVKPVKRGEPLKEESLSTRSVPLAYVEDRAVKATEKAKVVGLRTTTALSSNQTLLWTDLAITTEDRDLSSLVQPGKRAFTVRAAGSGDTRSNALIRPGDYVDVIVTMQDGRPPEDPTLPVMRDQKRSVVLLQRVLVLAVGLDTRQQADSVPLDSRSHRDRLLTLSLTVQQAQLLALASERGVISVLLRTPTDQTVSQSVPDLSSSALLDTEAREQAQQGRPGPLTKREGPTRIQAVR
jgi:pilus assembly protein CpaB